ncbi:MAG: hypothetical protein R3E84_16025 [Pseudomonadales bacterium]
MNAPQHLRLFSFASALAGTGGYKPEPGGSVTALQEDGRGWLFIHDLGLADLEPGKRARANYLQFSACLSWPQSEAETDGHAAQSSRHHDEQQPAFPPDCGLDLQRFRLEATISPAQWVLDVDGDGAHDQLAQVTDRASGAHDLVLCRAGASLHHLSSLNIYTDVGQGFAAMERWSVVPKTFASIGTPGGDTTWPAADGDVIVLERIEKSMHLVFMQDGRLTASTVYRLVEP